MSPWWPVCMVNLICTHVTMSLVSIVLSPWWLICTDVMMVSSVSMVTLICSNFTMVSSVHMVTLICSDVTTVSSDCLVMLPWQLQSAVTQWGHHGWFQSAWSCQHDDFCLHGDAVMETSVCAVMCHRAWDVFVAARVLTSSSNQAQLHLFRCVN